MLFFTIPQFEISYQNMPIFGIYRWKRTANKDPKTKAGIREITLSKTACVLLKQYKNWQLEQRMKIGDQWVDHDKLFTKWNGLPMHPDTISG